MIDTFKVANTTILIRKKKVFFRKTLKKIQQNTNRVN